MARGPMFRFGEPPLRPSKAKPDRAPFPPIQFQKESPREKEKAWRGGEGGGGGAAAPGGGGGGGETSTSGRRWWRRDTTRAERTKEYRATTRSARGNQSGLLVK